MDIILKYFPNLTEEQINQFAMLDELYRDWNSKINIISRKDINNLYEHHVLHSLGIAKAITFAPGTKILDVGTGGGFPGIPLAIMNPQAKFHLIDSIGKKIKVVEAVITAIGLKNASAQQIRSNELKEKFDFVVSRAVSEFPKFYEDTYKLIREGIKNPLPNGILYLKGGLVEKELEKFQSAYVYDLSQFYKEEFFEEKRLIYNPI